MPLRTSRPTTTTTLTAPVVQEQPRSSVSVGADVQDEQFASVTAVPGVAPFSFYSTTNASGQMLRPGIAEAVPVDLLYRGSIVGITVRASAANDGTYTVFINDEETSADVELDSGTTASQTFEKSAFEAAEGATVDVRITDESGGNPVEVIVYVAFEPSTIL